MQALIAPPKPTTAPTRPSQGIGEVGYIAHAYDLEEVAFRLKRHGYRGAICGPAGCGKSIMLQALGDELMAHGLSPLPLRLDPDRSQALPATWRRTIRQARHTDVLLLDDYDQLPRWARAWVWFASMRAGAVVVASKRAVRFKTLASPRPTAALFKQIMDRTNPKPTHALDYAALFDRCGGDLRKAMQMAVDGAECSAMQAISSRKKVV